MRNLEPNAYILDWTMNDYDSLLKSLNENSFSYIKEKGSNNIVVKVPFSQIEVFSTLVQSHLNSRFNYVDIQYPGEKATVVIFQSEKFIIKSNNYNDEVKKWAINLGLPTQQADWATSF